MQRQSRSPDNPFSLFETWQEKEQVEVTPPPPKKKNTHTHLVVLSFFFLAAGGDLWDPLGGLGIILKHYKDPYEPTSIYWDVVEFFFLRSSSDYFFKRGGDGKLLAFLTMSFFLGVYDGHAR